MKAMILGGVSPHIELIKKLKDRGYITILLDYNDDPPAKKYADCYYQVSTLDYEAVKNIAVDEKVDVITTVCVDHANVVMCKIAEELNLPHPYSYETSLLTTNKTLMKAKMKEYGIPTGDFIVTDSENVENMNIDFPVVVKPADNNGSKGVQMISDRDDLEKGIFTALQFSRKKLAIIEEFVDGKEIQVDCFSNNGKANVLMIREKLKVPSLEGMAMQSYGSVMPIELSESLKEKIEETAQKISDGFGLKHTPYFFQAIVKDDGIKVIELSPRIGGGLSYKMLKKHVGFDMINAAIDSYFGNISEIDFSVRDEYMLTNIMYGVDGVFHEVIGVDELLEDGTILSFDYMAERGKELPKVIGKQVDSRNRIGAYIIEGKSREEILKKAEKAHNMVDALNKDGKSILCKDLYYREV